LLKVAATALVVAQVQLVVQAAVVVFLVVLVVLQHRVKEMLVALDFHQELELLAVQVAVAEQVQLALLVLLALVALVALAQLLTHLGAL
jgi:hypothetical protein